MCRALPVGYTDAEAAGLINVGGLLALTSNIGRFHRDVLTWVPEVGVNFGYPFTERIRAYVGYN